MTTQTVTESPAGRQRHRPGFGIIALAVAMFVVGLTAGLLLGRAVFDRPTPDGLATAPTTGMLTDRVAAINVGDRAAIAQYYTDDAVLEEMDQQPPVVTETSSDIAGHLASYQQLGFRLQQTGTSIRLGPFIAEPLLWSGGYGGMAVYRLADDGRIAHQWVMGASIPGVEGP